MVLFTKFLLVNTESLTVHFASLKTLFRINDFVIVYIHFEERLLSKLTATSICILLVQWPYFQCLL